jgi:23S rRNA pseudouridine1911/1915/1917 synthase
MPNLKQSNGFRVGIDDQDRLDRVLASLYPKWSRTALQKLINKRHVLVDGHPVSPKHLLRFGQQVEILWPKAPKASSKKPEQRPIPFPILFEDELMMAINKPAGLVVHPSAGHVDGNTVTEILMPRFQRGPWPDEMRPGLVHRLDRDTSGVMVLAKNPEAHVKLSKQFAQRQTKKTYAALAAGALKVDAGTIESHLARHPGKRQRFAVSSTRGRWSTTKFVVKERFKTIASLVELYPLTGRTHQIRVHLASYGHPILGDHVYGDPIRDFEEIERQMLHAASLEIRHPESDKMLKFEAPLPADFQAAIKFIRSR